MDCNLDGITGSERAEVERELGHLLLERLASSSGKGCLLTHDEVMRMLSENIGIGEFEACP